MPRLSSIEQLREPRKLLKEHTDTHKPTIIVCGGTACQASGSGGVIRLVKKHILENNLQDKIAIRVTACHGLCEMGPFILTEPQNALYTQVSLQDVPRIVDAAVAGDFLVDLLYKEHSTGEPCFDRDEIPFFSHQTRSLLGTNQLIDPIRIVDYIARDGYVALEKALLSGPQWVIREAKDSGLRGRGGGDFPTSAKWEMLAAQPSDKGKYLVCNADEGDPGAFMDRSLLEGNPHSIIEGMIIGAYGTGATEGLVYVRTEYPLAINHLTIALSQARECGLLGQNILGTGFSFDIHIAKGAGAFVCGEETALIRSIEGNRASRVSGPLFRATRRQGQADGHKQRRDMGECYPHH